MVEDRWLRWLGPGVITIGALAAIGTAVVAAQERLWDPPACRGGGAARVAGTTAVGPPTLETLGRAPQARLDPLLDPAGTLIGQRLTIGSLAGGASRVIALPSESFAAGPFGRLVLVGADDGSTSTLETLDVDSGCASTIAREPAVIRRATIALDGATVYETRVDRASRADLGVWRRPLDGSGPATRILEPVPADPRFGPTWSTEFTWSLDGDRLAIQSCGATACRTRIFEPASGRRESLADPALGAMIGLAGDRLVTFRACRGFPCTLLVVDTGRGDRQVLDDAAGPAVLAGSVTGAWVVLERRDGLGQRHLMRVDPVSGVTVDLGTIAEDLALDADAGRERLGTRLPADWVLLTPDGSGAASTGTPKPLLRRITDGATRSIDEVTS